MGAPPGARCVPRRPHATRRRRRGLHGDALAGRTRPRDLRVGVGVASSPTPRGEFYVRNRLTRYGDDFYGPLAFGTSVRSPYRHGLAGRRVRRDPRHEPAGTAPRARLARLHPASERGHPAARAPDAGGNADHDPVDCDFAKGFAIAAHGESGSPTGAYSPPSEKATKELHETHSRSLPLQLFAALAIALPASPPPRRSGAPSGRASRSRWQRSRRSPGRSSSSSPTRRRSTTSTSQAPA